MKTLYLDLYFFLNLLADYLICLSTGRLCSLKLRRKRYLIAALFGAVYAFASIVPDFSFLSSAGWKLIAGAMMGGIAFGAEFAPLRAILSMLAIGAVFGGTIHAIVPALSTNALLSFRALISFFFLCYGLLKLLSRSRSRWDGQRNAQIRLAFKGREALFSALIDSGNSLRCPDTGESVLIASPKALRPIFLDRTILLEQLSAIDSTEALSRIPGFEGSLRLIPFRSLGGNGLVPVFRPERIWVDGKETDELLVAVSPEAQGTGFEAIL